MLTVIQSIVSAISDDLITSLAAASYPPLVDGKILLGRQHQLEHSSPPRVIMYPVDSVYGPRSPASASNVATNTPYSTESATQIAQRSIGTDGIVFEVQCWGWQPNQTDPQTVPDGNFDYTRILAHAVLQSIQRLMPGNPVVMAQQGHWPGSEMNSTQLDVLGRLFIFRTQPVPTPILDKLLPFVVPGTAGVIKTYITVPSNPTPELVFTDPPP